ncbi:MAG: glycosyltransferase [Verrucomicrobiales bacterium]|jgi:GT2 family glycosyltransferase|nr:glycosyltransferase [Verrucomicrobiales bacterium]
MKRDEFIVALIATYCRYDELKRCLDCLLVQTFSVDAVLVLDNARDPEIAKLAGRYENVHYLPMTDNNGCGAALKAGEEYAFKEYGEELTKLWILDDDAAPFPNTLQLLLDASQRTDASLIVPVCSTPEGGVFGFPDPLEKISKKIKKSFKQPEDIRKYFGDKFVLIRWAVGVCMLVDAKAVQKFGTHRDDFWMQGDDLEFSMRLSKLGGAVLIPYIEIPHLYPQSNNVVVATKGHLLKFCSLLQNLTYIGLHEMRSWHAIYCMGADYWRFFRTFGWKSSVIVYAVTCLWNGAVLAEPAGRKSGEKLRQKINKDFL